MILSIKKILPKKIRSKILYIRNVGFGCLLLNFTVKIFRKNKKYPFSLHFTSQIVASENIVFCPDITTLVSFAVSGNCYFQANNKIVFGKNCLIAPGVKIISSNHDFEDKTIVPSGPIVIGDDVWIGANAIILPGVVLGDRCVVGAGSVVTKSFKESGLIIAGNPAKIIRCNNG